MINATELDTTDLAAIAAWEVIQGFYDALPQLDGDVPSKTFNLGMDYLDALSMRQLHSCKAGLINS